MLARSTRAWSAKDLSISGWFQVESVATHCLLQAVVALVTRTRGLKAILLEDGGDEGARVRN